MSAMPRKNCSGYPNIEIDFRADSECLGQSLKMDELIRLINDIHAETMLRVVAGFEVQRLFMNNMDSHLS